MKIHFSEEFKKNARTFLADGLVIMSLFTPIKGLAETTTEVEATPYQEMQIVNQQTLSDLKSHPYNKILIPLSIIGILAAYVSIRNTDKKGTKHKKFTKRMSRKEE